MLRFISLILFVATAHASVIPPLQIEQPWETLNNPEDALTNCPEGTDLANGNCMEKSADIAIEVRPNCNEPEKAIKLNDKWICKEVLLEMDKEPINIVTVPPNCPPGQQWINGKCVDVWPFNIVTVPPNCPPGQKWVNGRCIDVWSVPKNIVTVPPNCPPGQEWINGECRDVWRMLFENASCPDGIKIDQECYTLKNLLENLLSKLQPRIARNTDDDVILNAEDFADDLYASGPETRRIVNIPNSCPVGFRPDANGVCRPIF